MQQDKNKEFKKIFGARIAKLRNIKNLSQEKFAEQINISQRSLSRIETGVGFAEFKTIEKIADVLGVDIEDLFNFNEEYTQKELIDSINKKIKFIKNDIDKLKTLNEILQRFF